MNLNRILNYLNKDVADVWDEVRRNAKKVSAGIIIPAAFFGYLGISKPAYSETIPNPVPIKYELNESQNSNSTNPEIFKVVLNIINNYGIINSDKKTKEEAVQRLSSFSIKQLCDELDCDFNNEEERGLLYNLVASDIKTHLAEGYRLKDAEHLKNAVALLKVINSGKKEISELEKKVEKHNKFLTGRAKKIEEAMQKRDPALYGKTTVGAKSKADGIGTITYTVIEAEEARKNFEVYASNYQPMIPKPSEPFVLAPENPDEQTNEKQVSESDKNKNKPEQKKLEKKIEDVLGKYSAEARILVPKRLKYLGTVNYKPLAKLESEQGYDENLGPRTAGGKTTVNAEANTERRNTHKQSAHKHMPAPKTKLVANLYFVVNYDGNIEDFAKGHFNIKDKKKIKDISRKLRKLTSQYTSKNSVVVVTKQFMKNNGLGMFEIPAGTEEWSAIRERGEVKYTNLKRYSNYGYIDNIACNTLDNCVENYDSQQQNHAVLQNQLKQPNSTPELTYINPVETFMQENPEKARKMIDDYKIWNRKADGYKTVAQIAKENGLAFHEFYRMLEAYNRIAEKPVITRKEELRQHHERQEIIPRLGL